MKNINEHIINFVSILFVCVGVGIATYSTTSESYSDKTGLITIGMIIFGIGLLGITTTLIRLLGNK